MIRVAWKTSSAAALILAFGVWAAAQQDRQSPAPDNTKTNQNERASGRTADQQKENQPDRELARQIRRAIVQDKSLSYYAHNVKIVAQGGRVTLKGPVKSEEEKAVIEQKAGELAGSPTKVMNELEVTGDGGGKPSPNRP